MKLTKTFQILTFALCMSFFFSCNQDSENVNEEYSSERTYNCTIYFDSNSGTGEMQKQLIAYGETQKLNTNVFVKEGYYFICWNTASNGSGIAYENNAEYYNQAENDDVLQLYAIWARPKSDALATEPFYLLDGTDGSFGTTGKYVLFGNFPQTLKQDAVYVSSEHFDNGYYLGTDGYYYAKIYSSPMSVYEYIWGSNKIYYFKVEPIKWRILSESTASKLLLADKILISGAFYAGGRPSNNETIPGSNYEYSDIRAYLNGLNGSSYYVGDYTTKGFIKIAFDDVSEKYIIESIVDNTLATSLYPNASKDSRVSNNTVDKIFLLSYQDIINEDYGFESDRKTVSTSRRRFVTDYAKATGAYYYNWTSTSFYSKPDYDGCGIWWLRSPSFAIYGGVESIGTNGTEDNLWNVTEKSYGIVPAMWISTEEK